MSSTGSDFIPPTGIYPILVMVITVTIIKLNLVITITEKTVTITIITITEITLIDPITCMSKFIKKEPSKNYQLSLLLKSTENAPLIMLYGYLAVNSFQKSN